MDQTGIYSLDKYGFVKLSICQAQQFNKSKLKLFNQSLALKKNNQENVCKLDKV